MTMFPSIVSNLSHSTNTVQRKKQQKHKTTKEFTVTVIMCIKECNTYNVSDTNKKYCLLTSPIQYIKLHFSHQ